MEKLEFEFTENPNGDASKSISDGLLEFNNSIVGPAEKRDLIFFARNESGIVVGGVKGHTLRGWLYIHQLWVSPEVRTQGLGTKLMTLAETEARKNGCSFAYVETYSFQALGFYKRNHYEVFGELDQFPKGHSRIFLKKSLNA